MTEPPKGPRFSAGHIAAPLRHSVFRRIWLASLLSNLGLLIQGVGAAWAMTQMTASADKVALVQTALMLPIMLISMPAGAIADMYDRRIIAVISLSIALTGATALAVLSWFGAVTPEILLAFCFVVGSGNALFGPAWQASVSEQVPIETLPSAVALTSPASSSTLRCCETAGRDTGRPEASSFTVLGPRLNSSSKYRRLGSAIARKASACVMPHI